MDAKDLLVHSPRVISNTTPCMFDIKLLRFGLLIGSSQVFGRAATRWQRPTWAEALSVERDRGWPRQDTCSHSTVY
jgi:hypothetical protein